MQEKIDMVLQKVDVVIQNFSNMDRREFSNIVLLGVAIFLTLITVLIAFVVLRKIKTRKNNINFALPSLKRVNDTDGMRTVAKKKVKKVPKKIDVTKYVEATEEDLIESIGDFETSHTRVSTQRIVGNKRVTLPTIIVEKEALSDFDDTLDEIQNL